MKAEFHSLFIRSFFLCRCQARQKRIRMIKVSGATMTTIHLFDMLDAMGADDLYRLSTGAI